MHMILIGVSMMDMHPKSEMNDRTLRLRPFSCFLEQRSLKQRINGPQ